MEGLGAGPGRPGTGPKPGDSRTADPGRPGTGPKPGDSRTAGQQETLLLILDLQAPSAVWAPVPGSSEELDYLESRPGAFPAPANWRASDGAGGQAGAWPAGPLRRVWERGNRERFYSQEGGGERGTDPMTEQAALGTGLELLPPGPGQAWRWWLVL
ncbi:hypothetical protein NDU88_011893 [Pleurodeles waltl]|uniref:Uncharacterized protein n=1 Tax=Pleurodeles waltl TaxID=8319 RepID=A0AAV7R1S3_PLEWA|nr:hypothetical protein NDU88_011893 [Pleurodeles waltl]